MDPSRPCNSKSRARNRYTRKELTDLAKKKGIKDISKKTIDTLCKEISATAKPAATAKPDASSIIKPVATAKPAASSITKPVATAKPTLLDPARACGTSGPNKYSRAELLEIAKKAGISTTTKMTMQDICYLIRNMQAKPSPVPIPSPNPSKCLIDITRPCGIKGANKYTSKEIKELWKSECKDLPEFKKIKPTTMKGYCSILHKRYDLLMLSAVAKVPEAIKKSLMKWLDSVKTKISKTKDNLHIPLTNYYTGLGNNSTITHIMKNTLKTQVKYYNIHLVPVNFDFGPTSSFFITRPNYVYNKNVASFSPSSHAWVKAQNDYILGLSWEDKIRTLTYTYGGDKIANSYLLGNLSTPDITTKLDEYTYNKIFPLALDIYLDAQKFKTYNDWAGSVFIDPGFIRPDTFSLFIKIKSSKYNIDVYSDIIEVLHVYRTYMKEEYWIRLIVAYVDGLTKVINNAPPAPKDGIFVYRGVTNSDYVKTNKNNVFVNNSFMSTSIDLEVALGFKSTAHLNKCCLFVIQVLPGARCLLATPISYFDTEIEVLFAPGRHMFVTRSEKEAANVKLLVTHFALTN